MTATDTPTDVPTSTPATPATPVSPPSWTAAVGQTVRTAVAQVTGWFTTSEAPRPHAPSGQAVRDAAPQWGATQLAVFQDAYDRVQAWQGTQDPVPALQGTVRDAQARAQTAAAQGVIPAPVAATYQRTLAPLAPEAPLSTNDLAYASGLHAVQTHDQQVQALPTPGAEAPRPGWTPQAQAALQAHATTLTQVQTFLDTTRAHWTQEAQATGRPPLAEVAQTAALVRATAQQGLVPEDVASTYLAKELEKPPDARPDFAAYAAQEALRASLRREAPGAGHAPTPPPTPTHTQEEEHGWTR